ncbi:ParB N-terminal domain-containing protein [Rugosimonospora acidiphila]|uniref:ParB N-terminal domain-containing protein n=1 Tax=Rugosimonospora acidiphila TaxID=556531 RepID=A0ABP9S0C0_9ACTN
MNEHAQRRAGADGNGEIAAVPIEKLLPADSPRLSGVDARHAASLADSGAELPPILVRRRDLRVIDGMHRLAAARLLRRDTIEVRFFDGDDHDAFVLAVELNVAQGLPLSLADRQAAVARILATRPQVSDRWIAEIAGLAPGTVGAIRRRDSAGPAEVGARIGRDGRVRPVDSTEGRRIASEVVARRPDASLREIARTAGISPATARDVRERMRRGDDPVRPRRRGDQHAAKRCPTCGGGAHAGRCRDRRDLSSLLETLARDPSLRFNESGRTMLRWLHARADSLDSWESMAGKIPINCAYSFAELAFGCAQEWMAFAEKLQERLNAA